MKKVMSPASKKSKTQVLITGLYRSGTEYISNLIGSHSDLSSTMYHVNALRFIKGRFDPINKKNNYKLATKYVLERSLRRYGFGFDYDKVIAELDHEKKIDICNIYDVIMTNMHLASTRKNIWAEKCQLLWRECDYFVRNSKNGFAVHIIRDPRSVLASFKNFTSADHPLYLSSVFNSFDSLKYALEHQKSSRIIVLKFEDVIKSEFEEVSKVWNKLGLSEKVNGVIDKSDWVDAYGKPWLSNSKSQKTAPEKFDSNKAINQWENGLDANEISFVEDICGDLMTKFGYELSGLKNDNSLYEVIHSNDYLNKTLKNCIEKNIGIQEFPEDPFKV